MKRTITIIVMSICIIYLAWYVTELKLRIEIYRNYIEITGGNVTKADRYVVYMSTSGIYKHERGCR